ncbi:flagellar protein FlgN [Alkalithermobacter paradoxus]|uniref:FlgN protein n=1 Tax=Alkalithermobacter paradoxus TaxID=29349 RepID=A0A1V4I7V3_9FIRM|nr:FlgN protein [[Clostridium] thermoalcaliphilum]
MNTSDCIEKLIELSEKKYILLVEMYEITKRQREYIKEKDDNALLDSIEKKQSRIDDINELDKEFYEIYSNIKKSLGVNSIEEISINNYPSLKNLKNKVSEIMSVLGKIDIIDNENKEKANEELNKVKNDIKSLRSNVRANKGYNAGYKDVQGIFIDNKK